MSHYFRDSPRFADRLRDMSDDELLREVKQRFKEDDGNAFFESGRPTRGDTFDRPFPHFPRGFPFDNDTDVFERPRGDGIRAHLDDLAARHPEFAEHLRGPPWPFGGSLLRDRRRRRRGSGGSNNDDQQQGQQQHQVDEDARSQTSGSSAASGASAVSSHSGGGAEHDLTSSSAIPQYGLRNTVDIGQQQRRRDMETSSEKDERSQRSMSAPPESWEQQQLQQQGQDQQPPQPPGQGQRFVSRVDITPQHNQQQQRAQSPSKPASNVRHIPIFVEGRDVPVMPKIATDDVPSYQQYHHQRQPSPPSHHFDRSSPPAHHFHRPSHFNERFSRQQWPPSHFQDAFYKPASFEQPMRKQQYQQQQQQPQHYNQQPQHNQQQPQYQQPQQPQQHYEQQYQQQQPQQPQYHQEQQQQRQQQQEQQQETPKPKPPKDPLEKVAQVQKDVDDLAELVRRYVGGSRQDKEYMYLDEMLTRELIKLDDIETEGRENVRQARKNAIKSIQDTISLLETKTPVINQQEQQSIMREETEECAEKNQQGREIPQVPEPMEIDAKQEKHSNEPIPLPPAPSSPKTTVESSESESAAIAAESANQSVIPQQDVERKTENLIVENTKHSVAPMLTETTKCADETNKESKPSDGEQQKDSDMSRMMPENKHATLKMQTKEATEGKTEANDGQRSSTESPRLQKKTKKTKKKEQQQQPVSEQAIPLPPPPMESAK